VAVKEFLLRLFFRGWSIRHGHGLTVSAVARSYPNEDTILFERGKEISETLRSNLKRELDADPFSLVRSAIRPYQNFCRGE
jgi:hypothetical protein